MLRRLSPVKQLQTDTSPRKLGTLNFDIKKITGIEEGGANEEVEEEISLRVR